MATPSPTRSMTLARRAANSSGGKMSVPVNTGCADGIAASATTAIALTVDRADINQCSRGRVFALRLELHGDPALAARQCFGHRVFAIELLRRVIFERLARDLLAVD